MKERLFQILLALADTTLQGQQIKRAVEEATEGSIRLWPGTLYAALEELTARSWIVEVAPPPGAPGDGAPRFFRLTDNGRRALDAEITRLARLLDLARAKTGPGTPS